MAATRRSSSKRSRSTVEIDDQPREDRIVETDVTEEMEQSFLEYAMSVIIARALPDVRDGLKPVQRRILYSMFMQRLRPDQSYMKSARTVGDTMGGYHPHGDSAIYEALVRLSQPFTLRVPLVDGKGNMGSIDQGPAASRYCVAGDTRVRLATGSTPRISELASEERRDNKVDVEILDLSGKPSKATIAFNSGPHPTMTITTDSGLSLTGTYNHPLLCLVSGTDPTDPPRIAWRCLEELQVGDVVCIPRFETPPNVDPSQEPSASPASPTEDALYRECVPDGIWRSAPSGKRDYLRRMLSPRGVALLLPGSPATEIGAIAFRGLPVPVVPDLQELLLEFGIYSSRQTGAPPDQSTLEGRSPVVTSLLVHHPDDVRRLSELLGQDVVRGLPREVFPEHPEQRVPFLCAWLARSLSRTTVRHLLEEGVDQVDVWGVNRTKFLEELPIEIAQVLVDILDSGYRFTAVTSIEAGPIQPVYSLRVESEDHSFLAGGFINHNTEARLEAAAMAMLEGIDEDTVDFTPTYDARGTEPLVLPSGLPNLLVNGATGIAVGVATTMVPHNLGEAVSGCKAVLENPDITVPELMKYIPGPDFPTGGIVIGLKGVSDAYATGRGSVALRARAQVTSQKGQRRGVIEVTELPYGVGTERIIAKVRALVNEKKLSGVAAVNDLTDRTSGLRLVIETKSGFDPSAVLRDLYRMTDLQISIAIQNVALVDNQPRTLNLKELCAHYIEHRRVVVRRRTSYRHAKATARAHLLDGLVRAVSAIDDVVTIIRTSSDSQTARTTLEARLGLDEEQATAVLDMPLRRLTSLEVSKLTDELTYLRQEISDYEEILRSPEKMNEIVAAELDQVSDTYNTPRRTTLLTEDVAQVVSSPTPTADEPCVVLLSTTGLLGRAAPGYTPAKLTKDDALISRVETTTASELLAITTTGVAHPVYVTSLPTIDGKHRGGSISDLMDLAAGEEVVAIVSAAPGTVLSLATSRGTIKRLRAEAIPQRRPTPVISLATEDRLVAALELPAEESDTSDLIMVSSAGQLLRFPAASVRPQGAAAGGVAGMRIPDDTEVIALGVFPREGDAESRDAESREDGHGKFVVAVASDAGRVKVSFLADYPPKGRGTGGVRCVTMRRDEIRLVAAWLGRGAPLTVAENGKVGLLEAQPSRRDASTSVGKDGPVNGFGGVPSH